MEALFDAADDDSATGGPDLYRRIYPLLAVVDAHGVRMLDEAACAEIVEAVIECAAAAPTGPRRRCEETPHEHAVLRLARNN